MAQCMIVDETERGRILCPFVVRPQSMSQVETTSTTVHHVLSIYELHSYSFPLLALILRAGVLFVIPMTRRTTSTVVLVIITTILLFPICLDVHLYSSLIFRLLTNPEIVFLLFAIKTGVSHRLTTTATTANTATTTFVCNIPFVAVVELVVVISSLGNDCLNHIQSCCGVIGTWQECMLSEFCILQLLIKYFTKVCYGRYG